MINTSDEEIDVLSRAARWVPKGTDGDGKPRKVSASTMWRWAEYGVAGVKLETLYIGSVRHTSRQALQRFFEAVTAARSGGSIGSAPAAQQASAPIRTESQRRKDTSRARETLNQMLANPPRRGGKAAGAAATAAK